MRTILCRSVMFATLALLCVASSEAAVPASRLARLAKGASITGWFRQDLSKPDEFFQNHLTDAEIAKMKAIGLTHVRLCVAPKLIMNEDGSVNERLYPFVRQAIDRLVKADLAVVVDLHNEDTNFVDATPAKREPLLKFWGDFAARLSNSDPEMVFLEILNEPVFRGEEDSWASLQGELVAAIRAAAPKHTIIATGPNSGGIRGLVKLKPVPDDNVVYSIHFYDPFQFTHQGSPYASDEVSVTAQVPYPSNPKLVAPLLPGVKGKSERAAKSLTEYGDYRWDGSKMRVRFNQALKWSQDNRVPIYVGEFGVLPLKVNPSDRARWFNDFGQLLRKSGVPWAVWGWDDGFGLGRKMEGNNISLDLTVIRALKLRV